jgi:hypothetical protein
MEFFMSNGVATIVKSLEHLSSQVGWSHSVCEALHSAVRCIKALVSSTKGQELFGSAPGAIQALIRVYPPWDNGDAEILPLKRLILDVLTSLCSSLLGHTNILSAFDAFQVEMKEPFRFYYVFRDLELYEVEFQVCTISTSVRWDAMRECIN